MNSLEKAILQKLKTSLAESTKHSWETGYFEDWVEHAKKMKNTILNSISVMDAMLNEPTEKEPEKEPDKN